ncbi:MAG TPA: trypsin-like peptidase domain-containing protein, partial [Acetobacteraceae bacterium]|nr:trypsin-like peptidase domain-containing protein [Acetobacteraceae bacterium]
MSAILRACRRTALLAVLLVWTLPAFAGDVVTDRAELIRSLLPTVVNLSVRKEVPVETNSVVAAQRMGSDSDNVKSYVGSGFVIDASGLIVTNYHVIDGAFEITASWSDGTTLAAHTLHASRLADLAILKVDAGHPLTPVQWGDSTKLRIGDQVFAIGNPLGVGVSVSAGIVSGLNRNVEGSPYDDYIQTDAAINHGNSGGPLFDMEGRVVGVDTALISPTESSAGLGLAIPADSVRFVTGRLLQYGWVNPGWMGVKVQQVTPELAAAMGLPQPEGSVVSWVMPASPAQKAGIQIGDVVTRYGDFTPSDERALLRAIVRTTVGQTVDVSLLRNGVSLTVPVMVEAWPRNRWEERDAPMTVERPKVRIPPDLGLSLKPVPTGERAGLGLEDGLTGVLVTGVMASSDAARRGITAGDVILRVQDKTVASGGEVQQAINTARDEHRSFAMLLVLPKV